MKKFLIDMFIIAILFLGSLYVLQFMVDIKAKNNYLDGRYRTLNTALYNEINADVVFFGNSRAQCHFDTKVMDSILNVKCYNMGLSGFPFDIQYHLVIRPYLQNNIAPKLIVYEISPQACLDYWNPIYQYHFLPYINNRYYDYYIEICDEISVVDRYLPFKYRGRSVKSFYNALSEITRNYEGEDCFTPIFKAGYSINFIQGIYMLENNPLIINQLKEFVEECNENNIKLLFVTSPMHEDDFYNHCHTDEFLAMVDTISNWANRLNYSLMFGSDTTFFAESTHLNAYGAKVFSIKLAHDIDSLGILK